MAISDLLKWEPMTKAPRNGEPLSLRKVGGHIIAASWTDNQSLREDEVINGRLVEGDPSIEDSWMCDDGHCYLSGAFTGWRHIGDEDDPAWSSYDYLLTNDKESSDG